MTELASGGAQHHTANERVDFNTDSMDVDEAYAAVENAAARCPVAHNDRFGGFEVLFRYSDVRHASFDWKHFSVEPGAFRPVMPPGLATPLDLDPPRHTTWRKLLAEAGSKATQRRVEPLIRADAAQIVDGLAARGTCDLVSEFAMEMPLRAICHVFGVDPEIRQELQRLSLEMLLAANASAERVAEVQRELGLIMVDLVEDRRKNPRDDYLTLVAQATFDGEPLTSEEIITATSHLIPPGFHTTVCGLATLLYELLARPSLRDRLVADPSLIPAAVEEALRLRPPIFGFYRQTVEPVDCNGVHIDTGEDVYLCYVTANRDAEVFEAPLDFDIDRPHPEKHLSFGFGVHFCLGAPLARLDMRVATEELLARLPDIELVDPTQKPKYYFSGAGTMSVESLPARVASRL